MSGGRVFIPIFTAGLGSCCLDAIREKRDEECDGLSIRCASCGNPMAVVAGTWQFDAGYEDASTEPEKQQ